MRLALLATVFLSFRPASHADSVALISATYSPGQDCTIYSYLLRISPRRPVRVGDSFVLAGLAPVRAVGDAPYWHEYNVSHSGRRYGVWWHCTRRPPNGMYIFGTFDVVVAGKAGVDFVEGRVRWFDTAGGCASGWTVGPKP